LRPRNHPRAKGSCCMSLRIYPVALQLLVEVRPSLDSIQRRDRNLHNQMLRASESMVLNLAEGSRSQGGNKRVRYFNSLGSTREVLACVEVAMALGYIEPLTPVILDRFQHVIGTLVRLVK